MKFLALILLVPVLLAGCKTGKKDTAKLNIILFGYDSIACYYGNSAELTDLRYGNIKDSLFMDSVLTNAKVRKPTLIALKPGGGASVLSNWEHVDTLFKINNFNNRIIDTLDEKEQKIFKTNSIIPWLKEHEQPLKLFLPKDDSEHTDISSGKGLVVLMFNESEVYAYNGTDLNNGRKYTYKQLGSHLASKRKDRDFFVVIKPGKESSYQNTVDMLDLMTIEQVRNYSLEDLTREEQAFIHELLNTEAE